MTGNRIIGPHGGYRNLISYKKSILVYEGTVCYCKRFLQYPDRTIDQMVQAARSCKQNIVEGCQASGTSKETELKLINVARSSLEELLEDYKDQLRSRNLSRWGEDEERMLKVRDYCKAQADWSAYAELFATRPPEPLCNLMICLICQTTYLLDRLLVFLDEDFKKQGGIRERMRAARHEARGENWSRAVYDYLQAATSPEILDQRYQEILRKAAQAREQAAKRLGRGR